MVVDFSQIKKHLPFFQNLRTICKDQILLVVRIFSFKKIYNDWIYVGVRIFSAKKFSTIRFVWALEFPLEKL